MTAGAFPDRLPADGVLGRPEVQAAFELLDRDGEEARLVGGAVRNSLLGLPPGDIDMATTAPPRLVMKRARKAGLRAIPTGVEHGTVTLVFGGVPIEVTTLREDVATDGRRATVTFGRSFSHDARRRDFTMNALYAGRSGEVVDEVGGLADLAARRVRFIGDPETRIREDYLRILRLFRFHAAYGEGELDRPALAASIRLRDGLFRLSAERIRAELLKLLAARRAAEVVPEVAEAGLLGPVMPLAPDTRAFARLARDHGTDALLRLAGLSLRSRDDVPILQARLRLSNAEAKRLAAMAPLVEAWHPALPGIEGLRQAAWRGGTEAARDALLISLARGGMALDSRPDLAEALARGVPALPFTGTMVVEAGVPPGPAVGQVLARAESLWLAGGLPTDQHRCRLILDAALAEAAGPRSR